MGSPWEDSELTKYLPAAAIQARDQPTALNLHLQLITSGAADVTPFQAAVKLLVQRMMIPVPPAQGQPQQQQ